MGVDKHQVVFMGLYNTFFWGGFCCYIGWRYRILVSLCLVNSHTSSIVFAELRCIRLTSGDCHVRCKLWPLSLNSACHVRIMTKPAGKRLQLSANKDILVCVNIYCTSMHTGEYSEPEPESKLQISAPRKQSIVNKPTGLFIDLRNVVTVTTLYVHQAQL